MASREEALNELRRRDAVAELARRDGTGGATPTDQNPAGTSAAPAQSAAQFMEGVTAQRAEQPAYAPQDAVRAGLRGLTMGASDALGSAAAAVPGFVDQLIPNNDAPGFMERYEDIRGAVQHEEDLAKAANPELESFAENVGTGGAILASGLPRAAASAIAGTGQALAKGASRVGAKLGKGTAGHRATVAGRNAPAGTTAGPYSRLPGAMAAAQPATRWQGIKAGAGEGLAMDALGLATSGDVDPNMTAAGAVAGGLFPKASQFLGNTMMGRMASSRMAGKVLGTKWSPWVYGGLHPSTRRWFKDLVGRGK